MGKINQSWYTSSTDLWATPQKIFEELDAEFHFTLDPCAVPENAKCANFYTPEQNGLLQNWGGAKLLRKPAFFTDEAMGGKMFRRSAEAKYARSYAYSCAN